MFTQITSTLGDNIGQGAGYLTGASVVSDVNVILSSGYKQKPTKSITMTTRTSTITLSSETHVKISSDDQKKIISTDSYLKTISGDGSYAYTIKYEYQK